MEEGEFYNYEQLSDVDKMLVDKASHKMADAMIERNDVYMFVRTINMLADIYQEEKIIEPKNKEIQRLKDFNPKDWDSHPFHPVYKLNEQQKEFLLRVFEEFGHNFSFEMVKLTHTEDYREQEAKFNKKKEQK